VTIDDALVEAIWALPGAIPRFAVELLRSLRKTHRRGPFGPPDMPINDPLAPLLASESALARTLPARVDIELAGRFTYGRTVVDFGGKIRPPAELRGRRRIRCRCDAQGVCFRIRPARRAPPSPH